MTVTRALNAALRGLTLRPEDRAAVALAKSYAAALDAGADPARVGPMFLSVLESLGMTPRARAAVAAKGGGQADSPVAGKLDELRRRRARRDRAADSDAASS